MYIHPPFSQCIYCVCVCVCVFVCVQVNQMLKVFNLSHNGLGDEGAAALVEALKVNTTLTELDIRYCTLGECVARGSDPTDG